MSEERSPIDAPEDVAILQALRTFDTLETGDLRDRLRDDDEVSEALLRQYTEVLGCLAYAAEPCPVSANLRERIQVALAGDETQQIDLEALGAPLAPPEAKDAPGHTPPPATFPASPAPPARAPYWLAAALAVIALGLVGGIFWLSEQMGAQRERLAAQETRLQELDERLESARLEQEAAVREQQALLETQDRFRLVTAADTDICPMRPPPGSPQPDAVGALYVAADHQHWYLRAEGLDPPGEERVYHLWFVTGEEKAPVSAGTFRIEAGDVVQLGSPTMPEGTTAVLVTIEPPEDRERPSGPVVLYGDELMRIL